MRPVSATVCKPFCRDNNNDSIPIVPGSSRRFSQSIFSPPSRPQRSAPHPRPSLPRRRPRNALHYAVTVLEAEARQLIIRDSNSLQICRSGESKLQMRGCPEIHQFLNYVGADDEFLAKKTTRRRDDDTSPHVRAMHSEILGSVLQELCLAKLPIAPDSAGRSLRDESIGALMRPLSARMRACGRDSRVAYPECV